MAIGVDDRAGSDHTVTKQVVGLDSSAVTDGNVSLEDGIDIDEYVLAAGQLTADIDAIRICKCHTLRHQLIHQAALEGPLRLGELLFVVDAHDLRLVVRRHTMDRNPVPEPPSPARP